VRKFLSYLLLLVFISGCGEGVNALIKISKEQESQQRFVADQRNKFKLLLIDIEGGHLERGISRQQVIRRYGEPVIEQVEDMVTACLYRDPLDFFAPQKVYLYFGQDDNLVNFEVRVTEQKETQENSSQ